MTDRSYRGMPIFAVLALGGGGEESNFKIKRSEPIIQRTHLKVVYES